MRLYDTLEGRKREFQPRSDEVKLYVCGINPYAPAHVGHAFSYISFDVLRRYLEFTGFRVLHVQNFTDVEDNIIAAAQRAGTSIQELTEHYIWEFFRDMDELNVVRAHVYPKATEEIPQIVEVVSGLLDGGYAYVVAGDVYFRVSKFRGYGRLSQRTLEGMMAGARIEVEVQKEHPMDFSLWKRAKAGEPAWDSPWGRGRPGWHIECSAMVLHHLGEGIDIHGGGHDLIFPHHENEIAQSEAFTGHAPFARFWMHNGLLQLGQEKMSKSVGNLVTIRDALDQYGPDALRMMVLRSHYRRPAVYSDELVEESGRSVNRLVAAVTLTGPEASAGVLDPSVQRRRFLEAMDDDCNTPQALAALFDLARDINRSAQEGRDVKRAQGALKELATAVLGFALEPEQSELPAALRARVAELLQERVRFRAVRDYEGADRVRAELDQLGITLMDTANGTTWEYRGTSR